MQACSILRTLVFRGRSRILGQQRGHVGDFPFLGESAPATLRSYMYLKKTGGPEPSSVCSGITGFCQVCQLQNANQCIVRWIFFCVCKLTTIATCKMWLNWTVFIAVIWYPPHLPDKIHTLSVAPLVCQNFYWWIHKTNLPLLAAQQFQLQLALSERGKDFPCTRNLLSKETYQ